MSKKWILMAAILIMIVLCYNMCPLVIFKLRHSVIPDNGFVADETTAIKIAEAVWLPIYGDSIYTKKPFIASYNNKLKAWDVRGSLPDDSLGGVPEITIQKSNGKILRVSHGR